MRGMESSESSRRSRGLRTAAAGLAITVVGFGGAFGCGGEGPVASAGAPVQRAQALDTATTRDSVWILTCTRRCSGEGRRSKGEVLRASSKNGRIYSRTAVAHPHALAADEGGAWVADFWGSSVHRIDPATGREVATVALTLPRPVAGTDKAFLPIDIAVAGGSVWVSTARGYVARIDAKTNQVADMFETAGDATGAVVASEDAVWVGQSQLGVLRIDPRSRRTELVQIEGPNGRRLSTDSLTLAGGSLWVSGLWATPDLDESGDRRYTFTEDAAAAEIDSDSHTVTRVVDLPRPASIEGSNRGAVWLSALRSSVAYRLGTRTRRVTAHPTRGRHPLIAVTGRRVWMVTREAELRRLR